MKTDKDLSFEELKKRYQLIEGDRKAYHEMSQKSIVRNQELISALRREIKELKARLYAIEAERATASVKRKTAGTSVEISSGYEDIKQLSLHLDEEVCNYRKKRDTLQHKRQEIISREAKAKEQIATIEGEIESITHEESPLELEIRRLETTLDETMIKVGEANTMHRLYGQMRRALRDEKVTYNTQLDSVEERLSRKKQDLAEVLALLNEAQAAVDIAKLEYDGAKEQADEDRELRLAEVEVRRNEVAKQLQAEKEEEERAGLERAAAERAANEAQAAVDAQVVADESVPMTSGEGLSDEGDLDSLPSSTANHAKSVFDRIKKASGISDIAEILSKAEKQSQQKNNLEKMVTEGQKRVDELTVKQEDVRGTLEDMRFSFVGAGGSRHTLEELEREGSELKTVSDREKDRYTKLQKTCVTVSSGIQHISDLLAHIKHQQPISATMEATPAVTAQNVLPDSQEEPTSITLDNCATVLSIVHSKMSNLKTICDSVSVDGAMSIKVTALEDEATEEEISGEEELATIATRLPSSNLRVKLDEESEESEEERAGVVVDRQAMKREAAAVVERRIAAEKAAIPEV
ncbi:Outer dynein arm-docking complex subunit 3 like protein [Aduncisulcus paluster]|uniref:Outer dynein arm-docking complex subunit 3 like protein n=1 Tax=Aduncisulcus paluster TaxID=2918883 RepID=A0ABQ5KD87_9EUKA|nr:Outer dynein arm-docking complex subunit 3 like protein [Aduncisulcus paluster]